jgi:hypothetical protein
MVPTSLLSGREMALHRARAHTHEHAHAQQLEHHTRDGDKTPRLTSHGPGPSRKAPVLYKLESRQTLARNSKHLPMAPGAALPMQTAAYTMLGPPAALHVMPAHVGATQGSEAVRSTGHLFTHFLYPVALANSRRAASWVGCV